MNLCLQLVQGVGVGVLLKKVSENDVMKWSSAILVLGYLGLVSEPVLFRQDSCFKKHYNTLLDNL